MSIEKFAETLKAIQASLGGIQADLETRFSKSEEEAGRLGRVTEETGKKLDSVVAKQDALASEVSGIRNEVAALGGEGGAVAELQGRIDRFDAALKRTGVGYVGSADDQKHGSAAVRAVLESPQRRSAVDGGASTMDPVTVDYGEFRRQGATISTTTETVQPVRMPTETIPRTKLRIRDLIRVFPMPAGGVEYYKRTGFHDAASVSVSGITRSGSVATATTAAAHGYRKGQRVYMSGATQTEYNGFILVTGIPTTTTFTYNVAGTPTTPATGTITALNLEKWGAFSFTTEDGALSEVAMSEELVSATPKRFGHFSTITKAKMRDDAQFAIELEELLRYGVNFGLEAQWLLGDGTGQNMTGMLVEPDVNKYLWSSGTTGDTKVDAIVRAALLPMLANFDDRPVAAVLSHIDGTDIDLLKGSDGHYILARMPIGPGADTILRIPMVRTNAMPASSALVGALSSVKWWERDEVEVMVAREHSDYPIRGKVAIIAEGRGVLEIPWPEALSNLTFDSAPA